MLNTDLNRITGSPEELLHQFKILAGLHVGALEDLRGANSQVRPLQGAEKKLAQLKKDYSELEQAHLMQMQMMHRQQSQIAKIDKYKSTIRTQEKVGDMALAAKPRSEPEP